MDVRKLVRFVNIGPDEYEAIDKATGDSEALVVWSCWRSPGWTAYGELNEEATGRTRIDAVGRLLRQRNRSTVR